MSNPHGMGISIGIGLTFIGLQVGACTSWSGHLWLTYMINSAHFTQAFGLQQTARWRVFNAHN